MVAPEEIEVTIGPDGRVSLMVRGLKGKGCLELTKPLEEALGAEIEERTYTSEYYTVQSAQPFSKLQRKR